MERRYSQFDSFTTYYYYDANGARIKQQDDNSGDTTYFDYYPNQMIQKITPPAGPAAAWEFGYDGQLNRHYIDAAGSPAYYLWDGLNCLEKRKATTGLLQARYTSVATAGGTGSTNKRKCATGGLSTSANAGRASNSGLTPNAISPYWWPSRGA